MKKIKKRKTLVLEYENRTVPESLIDAQRSADEWDKKELRNRATYFLLNGVPAFSVNRTENGRFRLLANERDFYAAKFSGVTQFEVRVYEFTERNAEMFSLLERLKTERLGAMEEAYLMKRLTKEFSLTQDDVAALIGKSRPAVANTLRLLTLAPEVVGLVESGQLSAGHARALVKVPKEKQYAFAEESIKRGYSVRETERAVKAFLTPPEVLQQEKQAKAAAKSAELKAFVERVRRVFRTKVSLIGNDKKGRIYVDYYSAEDLYRFEEFLDMIESFQGE
ncbi:MAG: ParB/RepB/Spo0J family partition protein [Clostridia bacterium]|nr:ParB/RepB/Spo0J family partition protein [Clostridia bacterium]